MQKKNVDGGNDKSLLWTLWILKSKYHLKVWISVSLLKKNKKKQNLYGTVMKMMANSSYFLSWWVLE